MIDLSRGGGPSPPPPANNASGVYCRSHQRLATPSLKQRCLMPPLRRDALRAGPRQPRNFFLTQPVIPRRWRNSIAMEHLQQHDVLDGDSTVLYMQVPTTC